MRYIGKLDNGKIFDSNTKGSPLSFTLGRGEVIKGVFNLPSLLPPVASSEQVDSVKLDLISSCFFSKMNLLEYALTDSLSSAANRMG
jgi:hypothetical protein